MTTSPDRPFQSATDKRQRILEAALKVFASRGVNGTPVPPIAREAGISVGSLYRYFESKEALVNTLFRETKQLLAEQLLENLPIQPPSRALFHEIWNRLCTFARHQPDAFRFLEMQDHHSYLDEISLESEYQLLLPLRQFIELGQQSGVLGTHMRPEVAMALFWGAIVGLFKAERLGYLTLSDNDLEQAFTACWRSITNDADGENNA